MEGVDGGGRVSQCLVIARVKGEVRERDEGWTRVNERLQLGAVVVRSFLAQFTSILAAGRSRLRMRLLHVTRQE